MIKFTTILWHVVDRLDISAMEYVICDTVYQLATNPNSTFSGWCYMSRTKMAERYGLSTRGLQKIIARLEDKKLINKDPETNYLRPTPLWCETYQGVNKVPVGGEQSSYPHEQSSGGGGEQSSYNIDSINIDNNTDSYKETPTPFQGDVSLSKKNDDFVKAKKTRSKKTPGAKFEPDLSEYDENTQGLILQWIEHRAALGKHIKTQYAISRFVAELRRLADGSFNKAKELVEYMRYREWQTVCPIPQNYQRNGKPKQSNEDHARTVVNIAANAIAGAEKSKLDREERERRIRESSPGY